MNIPKKYSGVLIGAGTSTVISFIISGYVTWSNLGFSGDFLSSWALAWAGAWPLAFTLAVMITPLVKLYVDKIVR